MSSTIPSGATLPVPGAGVPGRGASMVDAAFVSSLAGARSLLLVMVTMLARSRAQRADGAPGAGPSVVPGPGPGSPPAAVPCAHPPAGAAAVDLVSGGGVPPNTLGFLSHKARPEWLQPSIARA